MAGLLWARWGGMVDGSYEDVVGVGLMLWDGGSRMWNGKVVRKGGRAKKEGAGVLGCTSVTSGCAKRGRGGKG